MARRNGRGGYVAISGGSPTAVEAPADWAASTQYSLDDVVSVGSGADRIEALCVLGHESTASGLSESSGDLDGADKANWVKVENGAVTALQNWSFSTTEETATQTFTIESEDRTVGTQIVTTGQLVFADDDGKDVAQKAIALGNTVTLTLYPKGVGAGLPQYRGSARFTQDDAAFSTEMQQRTVNFAIQGSWTRSDQA